MARRIAPVTGIHWAGATVAVALALLTLGTMVAVALRAEGLGALDPAAWATLRFTVFQALLSALLSTALAIPVARALARRSFAGRELLVTLLGAPFILPVIVAVLGLLAVFGRSGWFNQVTAALGLPPVPIYGLHGVVLAHVFFNLPLATRLILQGWLSVPAERFRLAASLGCGPSDIAHLIERPMLRSLLPGIFVTIFLICLSTFAVALTLGGGPRASTVELAIYQAFRFDFDLGRAAQLSALQFLICGLAALLSARIALPPAYAPGLDRRVERWDAASPLLRLQDGLCLTLAAAFLLLPLLALVMRGLPHLTALPTPVWTAAARSIAVALASAWIGVGAALALAMATTRGGNPRWYEAAAFLPLAASPLVVGTGLFVVVFPFADPTLLALPITVLVNAALALPFAFRAIAPALREIESSHGRLADQLGLAGIARLRLLILPRLRRPLGFSLGLAAALSMGDLGVIALFASDGQATLPLQIYRLMGAYRMADAAAAALLLLVLSLALFWLFDRKGHTDAEP